jgi:hypothetical protein
MWIERVFGWLGSLRLTVLCLAGASLLVFAGTLAQVDVGIYVAQAKYFRSWFILWDLPGTSLRLPVFPGGYLLGAVILVNLLCAYARRAGFTRKNIGLWLVHLGLALMLLGQLASDILAVESSMRLTEGEARNYSEDPRRVELAVIDTSAAQDDRVVAIPQNVLARPGEIPHPDLPFTVRVARYWPNSVHVPSGEATGPALATQGLGLQFRLRETPAETRQDRRDMPTAYVELLSPTGSLGTWAVSLWLDRSQTVTFQNRTYDLTLRLARYYKPFAIQLVKFTHEKYRGTDTPRNFASDIRLRNTQTGEDRALRIYMNNPLRYGGETFYQSGFDERDPRVSILQVVRNPGWVTPYLACALVGLGLTVQFLSHLFEFVREKRA